MESFIDICLQLELDIIISDADLMSRNLANAKTCLVPCSLTNLATSYYRKCICVASL